MNSIVFLLLISTIILFFLLRKQKEKAHFYKDELEEFKEIREIQEIKASLKGRDQERIRIAKDWHDGIGNSLSTLKLLVDTIHPLNPDRHKEAVDLLENTQLEFRQIIDNELLNAFSNKKAILKVLEKWQSQLQIGNIVLMYDVYDMYCYEVCSVTIKSYFYRIVQELMNNVIKHSEASLVEIKLREQNATLELSVKDNGKGIVDKKREKALLQTVKQRINILNGSINIQTAKNIGTTIQVFIPLD